jgi:hypothetical protein
VPSATSAPFYESPSMEALQKARAQVEAEYIDPRDPHKGHTVYIGELEKEGQPTGEIGLVVLVNEKQSKAELPKEDIVPPQIKVQTNNPDTPPVETVKIDIQQVPQPTPEILRLDSPLATAQARYDPLAIQEWRQCFNTPIPGGPQIAPRGANYVGTLAGMVRLPDRDGRRRWGALTNWHVGVLRKEVGLDICQPSGNSRPFGRLESWSDMRFGQNSTNRTDVALIDTWRDDGPYAPGCHTVGPAQFKIGERSPNWVPTAEQGVGDRVQKSGRTTGHQKGRVVGVGAVSHVGYDQGTARFVNQIIIRGDAGLFSGPGDSGSLILTEDGNRPYALLFAGGGGTTIANPIQFVVEDHGISFDLN